MTSSGNSCNDFSEIVPTREITTKIEKTSFSRLWPWACLLNGLNAAASIAPSLVQHGCCLVSRHTVLAHSRVHSWTLVFSRCCVLPRVGRTDVHWSQMWLNGSESCVMLPEKYWHHQCDISRAKASVRCWMAGGKDYALNHCNFCSKKKITKCWWSDLLDIQFAWNELSAFK